MKTNNITNIKSKNILMSIFFIAIILFSSIEIQAHAIKDNNKLSDNHEIIYKDMLEFLNKKVGSIQSIIDRAKNIHPELAKILSSLKSASINNDTKALIAGGIALKNASYIPLNIKKAVEEILRQANGLSQIKDLLAKS